jgi:hypothetical protein
MRFFSSVARVLRLAAVSLLALGLAVCGLLLGTTIAASLLVLAGIKGTRAQRAASRRTVGQGSDMRSAHSPRGRLDVVDVEFREKRGPDGRVGPAH